MQVIAAIILIIVFALALALILSIPVMLLWNWLMPLIFGLKAITWLQALGLCLLARLLFGSGGSSTNCKKD